MPGAANRHSAAADTGGHGWRWQSAFLDRGQVGDDGAHVARRELEFRHVGMARNYAFAERLLERGYWVFAAERAERRGFGVRARAAAAGGMAHRAIAGDQRLAALLLGRRILRPDRNRQLPPDDQRNRDDHCGDRAPPHRDPRSSRPPARSTPTIDDADRGVIL